MAKLKSRVPPVIFRWRSSQNI